MVKWETRSKLGSAHSDIGIFADVAVGMCLDNLLDCRSRIKLLSSCHVELLFDRSSDS